jgi:hypothetical protein
MMDLRNTVLGQLLDAPRQADAMARRAQALQVDATFWEPYVEPNRFDCLPLWRCICAFKGMDPAHWALTSPAAAASLERYTTGEVAARLNELVQLHTRALGGIKMDRLKAVGSEAKGFETDMDSLIEWAEKVGEVRPVQCPAPAAQSTSKGPEAAKVHTTKDTRRDILTPVIEHAQSLCKDPWDVAEVWGQLHKLAGVHYLVLLHVEGKSIAYTDGDETKFLKRKVLADRIRRQKNKAAL